MGIGKTIALIKALGGAGGGGSSGGGVLIVPVEYIPDPEFPGNDLVKLTKTWQEIHDAFEAGIVIVQDAEGDAEGERISNMPLYTVAYREGVYGCGSDGGVEFLTDSPSGYPIQYNPK